jgi:hypothetical protein
MSMKTVVLLFTNTNEREINQVRHEADDTKLDHLRENCGAAAKAALPSTCADVAVEN